jgi:hypothetical protein
MTPEQLNALITAITALVIALGTLAAALSAIWIQLHQTHTLMNSRMSELLDATKLAGQKTGELDGRDEQLSRGGTATISPTQATAAAGQSSPPR